MQVLEKVRDTAFLGREFLAWLWFKTETDDELFDLKEAGKAELWFDGRMTLQAETEHGIETITCTGDKPNMKQARFALSEHKEITQAMIRIVIGENNWSFVLDSTWMNFRSFKTPKVMQDKDDDPDGIFYEKAFLTEEAIAAVDAIFSTFIRIRVSPEWDEKEGPALSKWINEIN